MNTKLRGLMAAAVIGGASLTGAAALPGGDAQALTPAVKKDLTKRHVVRPGNQIRLRQLARQIRQLRGERRSMILKLRALQNGSAVATSLNHGNCTVLPTRIFRARLSRGIRSGSLTPARARFIMRNARANSVRCKVTLRRNIQRTSLRIARLQRLYVALSRQRVAPRG